MFFVFFFFFFQAEDGIRDKLVTGVQTCALPIWRRGACLGERLLAAAWTPVAHTLFVGCLLHVPLGGFQLRFIDVRPLSTRRTSVLAGPEEPRKHDQQHRDHGDDSHQTSRFFTNFAFSSMNLRRGSTSSPISVSNSCDASSASSIVTLSSVRLAGSMVVSRS